MLNTMVCRYQWHYGLSQAALLVMDCLEGAVHERLPIGGPTNAVNIL